MSDNCLFQVSLILDDHLLMQSQWTDDKDAVIECVDEVNQRRCRDLQATVTEHDYHRGALILAKNGHVLVRSEPFNLKEYRASPVMKACAAVNSCDSRLRAAVTTRGSGRVDLPDGVSIGG